MDDARTQIETLIADTALANSIDVAAVLNGSLSADLFHSFRAGSLAVEQLQRDMERARTAGYPTADCLRPHEVERFSISGQLSNEQRQHVRCCQFCATLVGSLIVKQARLEDFIKSVRKGNRPPALQSGLPNARQEKGVETGCPETQENALKVIGTALKVLSARLNTAPDRRRLFRDAIAAIFTMFPKHTTWDQDLIIQADSQQWPGWAIECLPNLYIPLSEGGRSALAWHYLIACIPEHYPCEILDELCKGVVYEVHMAEQTARLVKRLAPYFEESRNGNPYPSNQAMRNVAIETMQGQLQSAQGDQAKALKLALERLVAADAVLPRFTEIVSALELLAQTRSANDSTSLAEVAHAVVTLYPENRTDLEKKLRAKGRPQLCSAIR